MSAATARLLASMGYNESPSARDERLGIRPAVPVSPEREYRRNERKRRTPDGIRAEMRADILGNDRLIADPENDWRRDQLEQNRRHHVLRYRLAISSMMALPCLPFPAEPEPAPVAVRSPRPAPVLRIVTKEMADV